MRKPFNPEKELLNYCQHICHVHKQTVRQNKKTGTWYWDYPAMAAICHDRECYVKRASYSHYPQKKEFHRVLEKKLLTLGEIGKRSTRPGKRNNIIGNCAEQHAANIFMKPCDEDNLSNLYFSKAMRPRTKQIIDYCDNCKDIFPNL